MKRSELSPQVRACLTRYPAPYDSHYGVVPLPPPETGVITANARHQCDAAMRALGEIKARSTGQHSGWLTSRLLSRKEAISSSAIEGTNSTLDELLVAEETQGSQTSPQANQVRGYALALDELVPRAMVERHSIFTLDLVRSLHRSVMKGSETYRAVPGDLRDRVVWIGGVGDIAYSTYNPAPPADVARCLGETLAYMRGEGMQMMMQNLLTRMAVAHAHFEAVHPFCDGNGRTGRLLLPLMMAAEDEVPLYLSPYIEAHKIAYYDALKGAQQRLEWSLMVGYLADAVVATVSEVTRTATALAVLADIWRQRRRFRKNSAAARSLEFLTDYPVVTVPRLSELLDVSFPAASAAVVQLVEAGILVERTGYARNRVFVAVEAISIINRPFGMDPILPGKA